MLKRCKLLSSASVRSVRFVLQSAAGLAFFAGLVCGAGGSTSGELPEGGFAIAADGETEAALVVADEPLVALKGIGLDKEYTQRSVAEELQSWLEKAGGVTVPILAASEVGDEAPLLLVGRSAWTERIGLETPTEAEGVRIQSFPRGVALLGEISEIPATGTEAEYDRGLFHAMRFFLERYLGYRFYFHHAVNGNEDFGIVIPEGDDLRVPAEIDAAFP